MIQPGKKEIIDREQKHYGLEILGLTEIHMRGSGFYTNYNGHILYFSGPENESRNGVALSVSTLINKAVLSYNSDNDRMITLKINTRPCRLYIVLLYAPTVASSDEDIEMFYEQLEDVIRVIPKRVITLLMGDLYTNVSSTKNEDHLKDVVGKFGLGVRNDRGDMWLQFCTENSLTITNTCFEQHPKHVSITW